MLCPEVWRFEPPSHEIIQKTGTLDLKEQPQKKDLIRNGIRSHHFNQMITVILPDIDSIPVAVETALADSDHYLIRNLPLRALTNRTFLEGFVKRGTFYAVSFRTRLDTDDCIAVTPAGVLVLHLNKETYQTLGLEGRVSQFARKRNSKYVVQIDLKALTPETNQYARVQECLGRESLGRFNLQISWTPPEVNDDSDKICASSVAKHFADLVELDPAIKVELMPTAIKTHQESGLHIPEFSLSIGDPDKEFCTEAELVEFMGMVALSCETAEDEYLNSYDFGGERRDNKNVKVLHWKGFFTTAQVETVYDAIRDALVKEARVPWFGFYVHGFSHCPISFGMRENYFHTDGENSYAVVLNPKGEYLWYQLVGNNKIPK